MMRRTSLGLTLVLALAASQISASSVGIARSTAPYNVSRSETILQGGAERPVTVNAGDKIQSGSGFLKIETLEGETVLLDENSALAVMDNALNLEKGRVAVAMPNKSDTAVHVYDLAVSPIPDAKADQSQVSNIGVGTISDHEVEVYSQGRMFRVTSLPDGNQIAVVGASDALRLVKDSAGMWRPIAPLAQDESEKPAANESEQTKSRRGFWIFPSAGAAAAVGAAAVGAGVVGYTVYENNHNDDNDDDEEEEREEGSQPRDDDEPEHHDTTPREPSSPDRPTRTPQPTATPLPTMEPTLTPLPTMEPTLTPRPTSTPIETEFL